MCGHFYCTAGLLTCNISLEGIGRRRSRQGRCHYQDKLYFSTEMAHFSFFVHFHYIEEQSLSL